MSNIEISSCLVWKHNSLSIIVCCSSFLETNMCSHILHTLAGSPLLITFVQNGRGKNEGSNLCSEHRLQTELPQWWQFFFPNPMIFRLQMFARKRRTYIDGALYLRPKPYRDSTLHLTNHCLSNMSPNVQAFPACASLSRNCILHCTALSKSWWWSSYPVEQKHHVPSSQVYISNIEPRVASNNWS